MTHNFCESCNRVRLTCTVTLYMCLGQEDAADLRTRLRQSEGDELLDDAILEATGRKPTGHDRTTDRRRKPHQHPRHLAGNGGRCVVPARPRLVYGTCVPGRIGLGGDRSVT